MSEFSARCRQIRISYKRIRNDLYEVIRVLSKFFRYILKSRMKIEMRCIPSK